MHGVTLLTLLLATAWADDTPSPLDRIDCWPSPGATKAACLALGCSWTEYSGGGNVPWCHYPKGVGGYDVTGTSKPIMLTKRSDGPKNQYGDDISQLYFSTSINGATFNVRLGPGGRYSIPIIIPKAKTVSTEHFTMEYSNNGPFSFVVRRSSTGTAVWNTSLGGLVFSDKFIQIATYFPTDKVYGFGENIHHSIKHDFSKYRTYGMLARDEPPSSGGESLINLYGVHPFYMGLEPDGKAYGVLIWNSNPQEVTIGMGPHLVYRTIGGTLDIYFFPGPTPEEVIQQYCQHIGKPFLPAYFALGFQLSRYGYADLNDMKAAVKRTQDAGIPLDIPYADIDYMQRYKDFTTGDAWSSFSSYTKELHDAGLHLFLIFDPAIQVDYDSYQRALDMSASFIEWERMDQVQKELNSLYPLTKDSKVMLSVVWPDGHVAFPDFLDPLNKTSDWWSKEFQLYHDKVPFDGIWIDMNEPAAFGTNEDSPWYYGTEHPSIKPLKCPLSGSDSSWDKPPYETVSGLLSAKTVCMLGMTARGTHRVYNTKNLYGLSEAMATQRALYEATGKRGAIISRSTFPSAGHYAGHWLGDNNAQWADLQTSVIGAQEFNLFGIPYVGSDICGFNGEPTEELCLRWQQMGAFHPFSSLHFEISMYGGTVIRPIFFEFPLDSFTHDLSYQFLWGSSMMILPVVFQGASSVSAYLPQASWYSLRDFEYGKKYASGKDVQFSAQQSQLIPVLARGGAIIPRQKPATTTVASRKNPFSLLITLEFQSGKAERSFGKFYWDDGESIVKDYTTYNYFYWEMQFTFTDSDAKLTITPINTATGITMPVLDTIDVMGYNYKATPETFKVNGANVDANPQLDTTNKVLSWTRTAGILDFSTGNSYTVTWQHSPA